MFKQGITYYSKKKSPWFKKPATATLSFTI